MELTDEEFGMLHTVMFEACIYPPEGMYDEDQKELISTLYSKVMDEAKRRGFWWAR